MTMGYRLSGIDAHGATIRTHVAAPGAGHQAANMSSADSAVRCNWV